MAAVDVVDPGGGCAQALACLMSALQSHTARGKWLLLHNILDTVLRNNRVFAVDVVLPGLLLTWLELRACHAWWQQQQARQQSEAAAHKKGERWSSCSGSSNTSSSRTFLQCSTRSAATATAAAAAAAVLGSPQHARGTCH
uniref:Uncharacterized protein n=1 Tax=Tetradesmus obliquus TaxID=3088 RepID=A0A383VGI1_TETOB